MEEFVVVGRQVTATGLVLFTIEEKTSQERLLASLNADQLRTMALLEVKPPKIGSIVVIEKSTQSAGWCNISM